MTLLYYDKDSSLVPRTADELAERIESKVTSGTLAAGERLPAIRVLAESLNLAPNTVAAAYRRLADRGVVVGRGRAGTFVSDRPVLFVHRSVQIPTEAVDLASGSPDPRLLPDLDSYVRHEGPSSSYVDPVLLPQLEASGVEWLRRQGLRAERLISTSGALDGIERVLAARLRPGDSVAVESPGWSALFDLVSALGMHVVPVEIDDRGMLPDDLARRIGGADAVVITPRAQNPFGAALDEERREELASVLASHPDALLIEDDHAGPIAGTPLHVLGHERERWAFIQSVAKALGPDLRLALVTGDDLTLDRVAGRFGVGPGWVSRILQGAVARMMSDPSVLRVLDEAAATYGERRRALVEQFSRVGLRATGRSGLNVWVEVGSEGGAVAAAAAEGFAIRGGSAFGSPVPAVRVTVSNLDLVDIPRLAEAVAAGRQGRIV